MITWNVVTGATVAASVNNGYINMSSEGLQITLPSTAAVGDEIKIVGYTSFGSGAWQLRQNADQVMRYSEVGTGTNYSTTVGVDGAISQSSGDYTSLSLLCVVEDTEWIVTSYTGVLYAA